jgi:digeranylgeranylglycerophospholipid reductase
MHPKHDFYDIIIIGGGPAGLTTAWYAAQDGTKVLVLERHRTIGIPVRCAEGVFQSNLSEVMDIPDELKCSEISGVNVYAPDGTWFEMQSPETGFILDRTLFDNHIAQLAINAGAEVHTRTDVIHAEYIKDSMVKLTYRSFGEIHSIKCHIIVGADGVESKVGQWFGLQTSLDLKDIDSCAQYRLENLSIRDDRCAVYFGNEVAPGGYAWVFPKSEHQANVGLGMCAARRTDKTAKEYLDLFIQKHFPESSATSFIAGGVPVSVSLPKLCNDNVMLVGDAARQTNPLTGGGIEYAMQAGKMAGQAAARAISTKDYSQHFLSSYQKEWDTHFKKKQETAYLLKNKLYSVTDLRMNELFSDLEKIPIHSMSYQALFFTILKNQPILLAKIAKSYLMDMIH